MAILVIAKMHNLHEIFKFPLHQTQVLSQLQLRIIICHHWPQCNHTATFAIVACTRMPFGFMSLTPKKTITKYTTRTKTRKVKKKKCASTCLFKQVCACANTIIFMCKHISMFSHLCKDNNKHHVFVCHVPWHPII